MDKALLTSGGLAQRVGVPWSTIHHWTKVGLISPVKVEGSGRYRYYDETAVVRCDEIRRLKMRRLRLDEIKDELDRIFGEEVPS